MRYIKSNVIFILLFSGTIQNFLLLSCVAFVRNDLHRFLQFLFFTFISKTH